MNPPQTSVHCRITAELGFAGSEEGTVLPDQQPCVELKQLFGVAPKVWGE